MIMIEHMQLEEVEMADQNADVSPAGKWKFPVFVFFQDARFPSFYSLSS